MPAQAGPARPDEGGRPGSGEVAAGAGVPAQAHNGAGERRSSADVPTRSGEERPAQPGEGAPAQPGPGCLGPAGLGGS
jgi:hypothetical protein